MTNDELIKQLEYIAKYPYPVYKVDDKEMVPLMYADYPRKAAQTLIDNIKSSVVEK
jgi:hypothetical protein